MGLLFLEIGMLIGGFVVLVKGRFTLGKNRVVTGVAARLAGLVMILPLPLAFLVLLLIAVHAGQSGQPVNYQEMQGSLSLLELAITVICFLMAVLIGLIYGQPPAEEAVPPGDRAEGENAPERTEAAEIIECEEILDAIPAEPEESVLSEPPSPKATVARSRPVAVAARSIERPRTVGRRKTHPAVLALVMLLLGAGLGALGLYLFQPSDESALAAARRQADARVEEKGREVAAENQQRLDDLQQRLEDETRGVQEMRQQANEQAQQAQAQKLRADMLDYTTHLNQALRDWGDEDSLRNLKLLEECPEKLRGWEYHYLRRQLEGGRWTHRWGHWPTPPLALLFHPDGKRILTIRDNDLIEVENAQTGEQIEILSRPPVMNAETVRTMTRTSMGAAALRPDGRQLALGFRLRKGGTEIVVRDLDKKGERAFPAHANDFLGGLAYSPDGKRLASASMWQTSPFRTISGEVKLWEVETGRELLSVAGCNCIAFHPDGQQFASGQPGGRIALWDAANGKETLAWKAHAKNLRQVEYSPDGKRIVSVAEDGTARVWEAATGKEAFPLRYTRRGVAFPRGNACFSSDGRYLAFASPSLLHLYDVQSGTELQRLRGDQTYLTCLAFSPDSRHLAAAGTLFTKGMTSSTLKLWDMPGAAADSPFKEAFGLLHPDGRHLICADRNKVLLRNLDGSLVREILALKPNESARYLAVSPDGKRLAIGGPDKVQTFDLENGQPLASYADRVSSNHRLAFSPDSRFLASCGSGIVKVWDTQTGEQTLTLSAAKPFAQHVAFRPDGRQLAALLDAGPVVVWDFPSGREAHVLQLPSGHTPPRCSYLAFSPDGKMLAVGRHGFPGTDIGIHLWDVAAGHTVRYLNDPRSIHVLAFSPDGKRLAAAGPDDVVRIWDVASGQEMFALKGPSNAFALAFSSDGRRLVECGLAGADTNALTIWEASP